MPAPPASMTTHRLRHRLARRLRAWNVRGPVVVAVSGGGDSVALLRLMLDLPDPPPLIVAHLDHGARGAESDADRRFVEDLAAGLGLDCEVGRWNPPRSAHFEADARRFRHDWLLRIAQARQAPFLAMAHTRDDQAETVLHRIMRGTGPTGLAGIPGQRALDDRVTLIRPLLNASREELRAYLREIGQPWREDATNDDPDRTRARIRHDLIPRLEAEYNPRVRDALLRLARLSQQAEQANRRRVDRLAPTLILGEPSADQMQMDRPRLLRLPAVDLLAVLRHAWQAKGWPEREMTERRWRRLTRLVVDERPESRIDLGQGVVASVTPDRLILDRRSRSIESLAPPPETPLPIPGAIVWGANGIDAQWDDQARECTDFCSNSEPKGGLERIDHDQLRPPLFVRGPKPGDRFDPLGLDGRSQALADFLRGRRVTAEARRHVPLVCDQAGIVWVVGHRIAHRARLTEKSTRRLELRWTISQAGPMDAPPPEPTS